MPLPTEATRCYGDMIRLTAEMMKTAYARSFVPVSELIF